MLHLSARAKPDKQIPDAFGAENTIETTIFEYFSRDEPYDLAQRIADFTGLTYTPIVCATAALYSLP
jgi:hypothetical protein